MSSPKDKEIHTRAKNGKKVCNKCGIDKPLSEYHTKRDWRDPINIQVFHYRSRCKNCVNMENRKAVIKYQKNNPEKEKVRQTTANAIARGIITRKPCMVCGETRVDAHHHDYSKPLDVLWLCRIHHNDIHHGRLFIKV